MRDRINDYPHDGGGDGDGGTSNCIIYLQENEFLI